MGVIALEVLTGRLNFVQTFFHQTIEAELERRVASVARTEAERALASALEKCLSSSREGRTKTVRDLRQSLVPAVRGCDSLPRAIQASAAARRAPSVGSIEATEIRDVPRRPGGSS